MGSKEEVQKMRKTNMRLFSMHKVLAWDYLFFYAISFIFLTQTKGISSSDVVMQSVFYSLFSTLFQIPANIIVEFLGKKNSIILGNILSCTYIVILMLSTNLFDLALAALFCALSFSLKNIAEPSLLNESVPPSRYKSKIYAKINGKGSAGYYLVNGISKIVSGYLYTVNEYLPFTLCLMTLIAATIISMAFVEPKAKEKTDATLVKEELKNIKDGFVYTMKSERLKALILSCALIASFLAILSDYHVALLEDIHVSSTAIGFIAAMGNFISVIILNKQEDFNRIFGNKALISIALLISISAVIAGACGIIADGVILLTGIIMLVYALYSVSNAVFYTIIDRYLTNFSNKEIDTKIFAANNLFKNLVRMMFTLFASFLLTKTSTANSLIILGIIFTIIYIYMGRYMKTRVGKRPEEYSKEERKYDELKNA